MSPLEFEITRVNCSCQFWAGGDCLVLAHMYEGIERAVAITLISVLVTTSSVIVFGLRNRTALAMNC